MSTDEPIAATIDQAHFRQVLGHFPTGVTVVTATAEAGTPVGLAVGSFFSVSLDPPLVGFCAGKTSSTYPKIEATGKFAVNVLASDQEEICRVFASKVEDKFEGLGYRSAHVTGAPVLDGVLAWIDCDLEAVHEAGDHWVVIGRVRDLDVAREGVPMVFFRGGFGSFTSG